VNRPSNPPAKRPAPDEICATGAVKETAGKILGDAKLQSDGKTLKVEGTVQNAVGGVVDALKK